MPELLESLSHPITLQIPLPSLYKVQTHDENIIEEYCIKRKIMKLLSVVMIINMMIVIIAIDCVQTYSIPILLTIVAIVV